MRSSSQLPSEPALVSPPRKSSGPCSVLLRILAALICLLALSTPGRAQDAAVSEYQVKAAYLYNFAKFVEWPSDSFSSASAPFEICIFGEDPFGEVLQNVIRGKQVNGRSFEIRGRVTAPAQAASCHILFVSTSATRQFQAILQALRGRSVLIVGESPGFAERGGMINFVLEGGRVLFEVNQKAARQAGLKISAKLLTVAKQVMA